MWNPRACRVSTKHFVSFLKKREFYEKQVAGKNKEPGTSIMPMSYRACMDDAYLRLFITAQWVEGSTVGEITEDQLKHCVKKRASLLVDETNLHRIDQIVKKVQIDMTLIEAEDRVRSLHFRYVQKLESAGIGDLTETKPHICIEHIMTRIQPRRLKSTMKQLVRWRKLDQFDKKDFGAFMRELAVQATKMDEEEDSFKRLRDGPDESSNSDSTSSLAGVRSKDNRPSKARARVHRGDAKQTPRRHYQKKDFAWGKRKDDGSPSKGRKRQRELPPCLNVRKCKGRHFINDCPNSSAEEQKALKEEYYSAKKQRTSHGEGESKGYVRRIGANEIDSHSPLFSATFAKGAVETVVLADSGSDTNLVPSSVLEQLLQADATAKVTPLTPPHLFSPIKGEAKIFCSRLATADVQLRIRHGTKLLLRNLEWRVSDEELDYVVIGRPVLQAIGCDNRALLAAACDKHDGVINVPDALKVDEQARRSETSGRISACLSAAGGVYHSHGSVKEDALEESDVYIDLGDESEEDLSEALDNAVKRAVENGLSKKGAATLEQLLTRYRSVFE